jgi:hypothetical protein
VTGRDSFRLGVNYWPARTAMYWWDDVSFPTVDQISCLGSAGCATGHDAHREGRRAAPRGARQPSAIQEATSARIASCCRTATTSLLVRSARFLSDGTLCEAEAGLSRPPGELCATLGVR